LLLKKEPLPIFHFRPTHFFVRCDTEHAKNVRSLPDAAALAIIVLPVPGGPYKRTPLGDALTLIVNGEALIIARMFFFLYQLAIKKTGKTCQNQVCI